MKTFLMLGWAALLASPALAQDAGAAAAIDAEFATSDTDSNGALSKAEFGTWIKGLKKKSDPNTPDAELDAYAEAAFTQADSDKDGAVSKTELSALLKS